MANHPLQLKIRRATAKDLPALRRIFLAAYHASYAAAGEFYANRELVDPNYATSNGPYYKRDTYVRRNLESIKARLKPPFCCWLAVREKKLAGYIITERNQGKLWINDLLVSKSAQRSGIGRQLFEHATRGQKSIYLWVNSANPAQKFWKKMGFKLLLQESLMKT